MRDVETLRYNAQNRRLNAVDESNTYKDQALWNRSAASSAKKCRDDRRGDWPDRHRSNRGIFMVQDGV